MEMKIPLIAISAFVVVIVLGSVLMPVLTDASDTEDTFTNEGMYYMTDKDNYTFVYDPTGKFIVNGNEIPFTDIPTGERCTLVSTEELILRFANASSANYSVALINDDSHSNICDSTDAVQTTVTMNNGTLTVSKNGVDTTYSYTQDSFRGIAKTGEYVMTKSTVPTKVNSDTTIIIGNGATQVSNWYDRFYIVGTVEDMTVTPPEGITVSNVVVNSTPVSGYKDLVEFSSIQFTASDGVNTVNATYNRVIVPTEITAEKSVHLSGNEIALLSAIPALIIVALLIGVLAVWARSKMD